MYLLEMAGKLVNFCQDLERSISSLPLMSCCFCPYYSASFSFYSSRFVSLLSSFLLVESLYARVLYGLDDAISFSEHLMSFCLFVFMLSSLLLFAAVSLAMKVVNLVWLFFASFCVWPVGSFWRYSCSSAVSVLSSKFVSISECVLFSLVLSNWLLSWNSHLIPLENRSLHFRD